MKPLSKLRKAGLKWLEAHGKTVKGSVLHVGSGDDAYHYKQYFPNASKYQTLDKNPIFNPDIVADVQNMPEVPSESEGCIVATFMLYQVPNIEDALQEFRRVLKPNGILLATFTSKYGGNRVHVFNKPEAIHYTGKYFEIENVEEYCENDEFVAIFIRATKDVDPVAVGNRLWFDDALKCQFELYPLIETFRDKNIEPVVAVITGKVGKTKMIAGHFYSTMTLDELKILVRKGWTIASHSVTHPQPDENGRTFKELSLEETEYEARESKRWIEQNLGVTPTIFVVPQHERTPEQEKIILKYYKEIRPIPKPECPKIWHYMDETAKKRLLSILKSARRNCEQSYTWSTCVIKGKKFEKKMYRNYAEYISHQKSKLKRIPWLSSYDRKYSQTLKVRLKKQGVVKDGMTVLCLGARIGTEVKAFLALNCFAVGIDLNPGENNKYVLHGDFHDIQFPSQSVDVIFTNCLDHIFDFDSFLGEIKRVLKPSGFLILEIEKGKQEGGSPGHYESLYWQKIDDIIEIFVGVGFRVIKRMGINYPWNGQHIIFKLDGEIS